jgi:hypothetical protein
VEETVNVDLQHLEEKYGKKLIEALNDRINYFNKENHNYKIEIFNTDSKFIHSVLIATNYMATVYEVSVEHKHVINEYKIPFNEGQRALELMASIN